MNYVPDRWVILEISRKDGSPRDTINKVFAGWYGGFTSGDAWKLNSGIEKITEDEGYYYFHGYSGSIYQCHKSAESMTGYMTQILESFRATIPDNWEIKIVNVTSIL